MNVVRQHPSKQGQYLMRIAMTVLAATLVTGCESERDFAERTQTDYWYQSKNNEVDILWVVDNSCSMAEEQDTLAQGFTSFVSQMETSATDFHIGVISTSFDYSDPDRGKLLHDDGEPAYLTLEDDYVGQFQKRAVLGVEGSDKEKGLEAADWALSPTMITGANSGFMRLDAQLLIVFVSDEEDCSDEGALEGEVAEECYRQRERLVPIPEYVDSFRGLKKNNGDVQVSAIVGTEDKTCEDAYPGARYIQTAAMTGGTVGDICTSDWSSMLADLGLTATGVRTSFQTSFAARPETLKVFVDEEEVMEDETDGWTYDSATWYVTFGPNAIPERDAEIYAEYTILSGAAEPEE